MTLRPAERMHRSNGSTQCVAEDRARWMGLVTIDGPSAAGKSTAARGVAALSRADVLEVGLLYREIALRLSALAPADKAPHAEHLRRALPESMPIVNERAEHRSAALDVLVPAVAADAAVRAVVERWQREWRESHPSAIVVGRVGGLRIFPDADVKVYLTAADAVRRARRGGPSEVQRAGITDRDASDRTRVVQPFGRIPDAVVIDTTAIAADKVAQMIWALMRRASEAPCQRS